MNKLNFDSVNPEVLGNSQKGQDSSIKHVFDTIGTTNKFCIEFGAVDGYDGSNTLFLRNQGWNALLLDNMYENPSINLHRRHITKDNICSIFKVFNVPTDLDFLSIDIDGNDYWILSSILTKYSPRVIMIETNVRFEPYDSMVMKYIENWRWDFGSWYGASPYAYKKLVNQYGYTPVHMHIDDMIIVRNDCLHEDDINKDWLSIYSQSNKSLYNGHIRPGESVPVVNLETEKWMEV